MKKKAKPSQIDMVTLTVINNALVNICREMGTAMMRTSYSPIFNEALDFSCVIFNPRGEMIGQYFFMFVNESPVHCAVDIPDGDGQCAARRHRDGDHEADAQGHGGRHPRRCPFGAVFSRVRYHVFTSSV